MLPNLPTPALHGRSHFIQEIATFMDENNSHGIIVSNLIPNFESMSICDLKKTGAFRRIVNLLLSWFTWWNCIYS